jgi:hypothetical protein
VRHTSTSNNPANASGLSFDGFLEARVYDARVVLLPDLHEHLKAAEAGSSAAIGLVKGVDCCLRTVEAAEELRCLACDQTFHHTDEIGGFAIISPFAAPQQMIVAGFCTDCVARHRDLLALVLRHAREIWGNLRCINGGRA